VTSQEGPVYTCAWIAKHPVEATRARVSCKLSGDNGTAPRNVPEPPPVVDPALGGFVTSYRDALADGTARLVGDGEVEGTPVHWLELRVPVPRPPEADQDPPPFEERVAIDRDTYRPLLVRPLDGKSSYSYEVVTIETVTPDKANFSQPRPLALTPEQRVAGESVVLQEEIQAPQARSALGTPAFWLGREFAGLELRKIERQELRTRYDRRTGLAPREGLGLELTYGGPVDDRPRTNILILMESTEPQMVYRWGRFAGPDPIPPAGAISLFFGVGLLHRDGVYVTIWAPLGKESLDEDEIIEAARALQVIPG
jgi:hypothetical protein